MIIQVINLSENDVFKYYCRKYDISEGRYSYGLYGLEVRGLSSELAKSLFNHISNNGARVYVAVNDRASNIFLMGSIRRIKKITKSISKDSLQKFSIKFFNTINFFENYNLTSFNIGNKNFSFKNSYIMGILNVTPDSFSDGGKYDKTMKAIERGLEMIEQGADIIDIGGESSRPGAEPVDLKTELYRVIPVIRGILTKNPDAIISVDTKKKLVAEMALKEGAKIINDISGLTADPSIIKLLAEYDAVPVIMHMKGSPKTMQDNPVYNNVVEEVYDFLAHQSKKASKAGLRNMFIDPGIGFGKRLEDNYTLLRRLDDFKSLSYPIVIGVSRKSFIGETLNLNVDERDIPTSMVESYALSKGARILRTHNVKYGVQLKELFNRINNTVV